jgi:hypothetical protein
MEKTLPRESHLETSRPLHREATNENTASKKVTHCKVESFFIS